MDKYPPDVILVAKLELRIHQSHREIFIQKIPFFKDSNNFLSLSRETTRYPSSFHFQLEKAKRAWRRSETKYEDVHAEVI